MTSIDERLCVIVGELVAGGISLAAATEAFQIKFIAAALRAHKGNSSRAAVSIGVHRNTLLARLRGRDDVPRRRNRSYMRRPPGRV